MFELAADVVAVEGDTGVARLEVRYSAPLEREYRDIWIVTLGPNGLCTCFEEWPFWPEHGRVAPGWVQAASAARTGAGVSAAATITSTKASDCTTMPSTVPGIGSPKTTMPPMIADTLAATLVQAMTGTASPCWSPLAEAKKAMTEPSDAGEQPRRREAGDEADGLDVRGQRLDRDVGDAEEDAGGDAEQDAVVRVVRTEPRREDEQHADGEQSGLEGDHAAERVAGVRAGAGGEGDGQQREAERGEPDADPLAAADVGAEPAVGDDREEDEPAREDGLDERERREREGADVEDPGEEGDAHAEGERARAEEGDGAAQRVARLDGRGGARAAVLQQEAEVGEEGADERQEDADFYSQDRESRVRCGVLPLFALSTLAPAPLPCVTAVDAGRPEASLMG